MSFLQQKAKDLVSVPNDVITLRVVQIMITINLNLSNQYVLCIYFVIYDTFSALLSSSPLAYRRLDFRDMKHLKILK